MSFIKGVFAAFSIGISFLMIVGITLILDLGVVRAEFPSEPPYVNGDSGDGLENDGFDGDPTDGLGKLRAHFLGDPTDGLDLLGDPRDGLDYHKYCGDPGDGMDFHPFEFHGYADDGLYFPFGDPGDGLGYLNFLQLVWTP